MTVKTIKVDVVTDAGGDFTTKSTKMEGKIVDIRYVYGTLAATTDVTIVGGETGKNIWTETGIAQANKTVAPRQATHDEAGVASLYAATFPVEDHIRVNEQISITIANGGNTTAGTIYITVED